MKLICILTLTLISSLAFAASNCDVRIGDSSGIQVVEFATGNVVHSRMTVKEGTADALLEEVISLQDMGLCAEKIHSKKCLLKFEKKANLNTLIMFRGQERWMSWAIQSKKQAQDFIRSFKRAGFCS